MKLPEDGWIPLSLRSLLFLLRRSPLLQTVCMHVDVCGCAELSAGFLPRSCCCCWVGGSTAPGRALGENAAAPVVPWCLLLWPHVPLGACSPGGWLRVLLHGSLDALTRQQFLLCCGRGSHRWVSLRTHVWLGACFHFLLRKGRVMGEK